MNEIKCLRGGNGYVPAKAAGVPDENDVYAMA
jgi:hypothetical protein